MYIDALGEFSSAQALTATALGTNVIDLSADRSIGNGEAMTVMFIVTTAADQTTGDEDYTFGVEYATNAAQTTGVQVIGRRIFESGTPTAPAQDADLLVAGFKFFIDIPATKLSESAQYLGVRYTLAGTSPSITVDAYLIPKAMADQTNDYADGFTIV